MSNEEIIKNLTAYMYYALDEMPKQVGEAISAAISALRKQDEMENNPLTNFDRITESPEVLAETIFKIIKNSDTCECPAFSLCNGSGIECKKMLIKWLKQEAIK